MIRLNVKESRWHIGFNKIEKYAITVRSRHKTENEYNINSAFKINKNTQSSVLYHVLNSWNFDILKIEIFQSKIQILLSILVKIRIMAELTAKLFRDFFGGSWSGKITKNGEFQSNVTFNWPEAFGKFSAFGTEAGSIVPHHNGVQDDTRQIAISGWHSDTKTWNTTWYNEFGGYGELKWRSQDVVNGVTIIYGSLHECKQETDDQTDHIAMCEIYDQDNFKYTLQSLRKGILEIFARRIRTGKELNELLKKQASSAISFEELCEL
jgi:hypothetical protein